MQELKCYRCGKVMKEKHVMLQSIVYLGDVGPRHDICDECYKSFLTWLSAGPILLEGCHLAYNGK